MFYGIYTRKLDDKNRVRLPSDYDIEETNLFLTILKNKIDLPFLCVTKKETLEKIIKNKENFNQQPIIRTKIDNENRILLPNYLNKIITDESKKIIFIGHGEYFSMYNQENSEKFIKNLDKI